MSKRNFYFGGFSLLVAGAAIAGGAAVSSSAMADGGSPADDLSTVSWISVSDSGVAIECTLEGIDLGTFVGNSSVVDNGVIAVTGTATIEGTVPVDMVPVEALPAGEGQSFSVSVGGDGVVTDADGNVIESGQLVEAVELTPAQMEEMNANMQVISADDVRQGTPEECAAWRTAPATPVNPEG